METLAPLPAGTRAAARIPFTSTRATEFIDMTDRVAGFVARGDFRDGFVNVQSLHTTVAIVVNEHEPLLLADFVAFLERLAPAHGSYRHDDWSVRTVNVVPGERSNGHAHCRALLLPTAACLNVVDGRLQLGRWQRLFAVELDGPRQRAVSVVVHGGAR